MFSTTEKEIMQLGVKCLIYAGSGMGKTMLCATAPRPLIISAESGLLSLSRKNIVRVHGENAWGVNYDPLNVITVTNIEDLQKALEWCKNTNNHQYFDTVILDSLTEMGEVFLKNAKKLVKDVRQAYGELIDKMDEGVREFRDIKGKHVVLLCKQEPLKDELTGVVVNGPMMPGAKLANKLPYLVDEVFALRIGKTQQNQTYRFLQTQPDLQYIAKDRSGTLDTVEPAHLAHIFTKILGV